MPKMEIQNKQNKTKQAKKQFNKENQCETSLSWKDTIYISNLGI